MYKAAAFALYGVEDARRLTKDQRAQLELVFQVKDGSTNLLAPLEKFLEAISKAFENMDSKHRAITMISIALILVAGFGAYTLVDSNKQVAIEQAKQEAVVAQEREKTRQFALIAQAASASEVVEKFAKASEKGARAIVEAAPDANRIRVGRARLEREDIEELNQRAVREKADAAIVIEPMTVLRVEPRQGNITRLLLQRADGSEFTAILQDDELAAEDVQRIWQAAQGRKQVMLEINATMMRSVIKSATILRAPPAVQKHHGTGRLPPGPDEPLAIQSANR